jgi:hypothetical protein
MPWRLALLLSCVGSLSMAAQSPPVACTSAAQCAAMAREAIGEQQYEHAHDLAWRAVQTGRRNDPDLMYLLARTQSLSGRAKDSFVMLQRLAAMGFRGEDVETSEDFRRVRALPEWSQLTATSDAIPVAAPAAASAAPSAPPAPSAPAPSAPEHRTAPSAPDAPSAPVAPALRLPKSVSSPIELAYDAVSARFVVADDGSNTLKVVDELAGNAVDLVAPDWTAPYRSTAIAIDTRRGDLWTAAVDEAAEGGSQSIIYKLQLVSGRQLQTIHMPKSAGAARIVDIAVGANTIFLLDALGGRIFSLAPESTSPRLHMRLVGAVSPAAIAMGGGDALYVAHAKGVMRADLATRTNLPLIVNKGTDVTRLQSIAWHDGSLFGIQQQDSGELAVQIQLDRSGKVATSREVLGQATARAAVVNGDVFYFLGPDGDSGAVVVRKPLSKNR